MLYIKFFLLFIFLSIILILVLKKLYYSPIKYHINFREDLDITHINLNDCKGIYLHGISQQVIIIYPAEYGNLSYHQNILINLNKLGYKVYIFDYPGFINNIVTTETNIYKYSSQFTEYVLSKHPKNYIHLMGISLGSIVASHIGIKYQFNKMIFINPLISIKYKLIKEYKILEYISFLFYEFDILDYLRVKHEKQKILAFTYSTNPEILSKFIDFEFKIKNEDYIRWNLINYFINEQYNKLLK